MWLNLIFGGVAAIFFGMTCAALWQLRWVRRLPSLRELTDTSLRDPSSTNAPLRCSVVIAARDEAARIELTIRHLLAQQGVDVELIVVNDRSTDGTGEILRRLEGANPRMKCLHVEALPEGWLGKCHACHVGASEAKSDWILFTDADCWLKPDVILRAIRLAERDQADHVTLSPGTVVESFGARAWHLLFLTSLLGWFSGVNRDRRKSFIGIGAFNLVKKSAYSKCGGYEALRLTVVDDVKLGLLLRRAGCRTRGFLGVDDVECHWGKTVRAMAKIMEKNYFAVLDYRLHVVLGGSAMVLAVLTLLVVGLLSGSMAGVTAAFSPFLLGIPGGILARRLGWPWINALGIPFMIPIFWLTLINSTFVTLRQGGVRWRDTFYPLETLRKANVR
jgi:cellulose synthase/poly-beta-1,6-N-acetylglucosamine synthase-like glycosyltransferase